MWGVSCLLGGLTSSASVQWVFYRSSSTCRCISDVSVGRKLISASYSSAILPLNYIYLDAIQGLLLLLEAQIEVAFEPRILKVKNRTGVVYTVLE